MKNIKIVLSIIALAGAMFVSCKKEIAQTSIDQIKKPATIAKAETTTFTIEGMSCAMGCAKVIETKVAAMEGVQKATVDFDKKTATIEYDAATQTPEKIVETVEAVADGKTYKVSNVKSTADKAMLYQEKPSQEKKKAKKATNEVSTTTASPTKEAGKSCGTKEEKKGGCCAGKKSCSVEKPATM
jgi:periplasmic mercuric ion binding protein